MYESLTGYNERRWSWCRCWRRNGRRTPPARSGPFALRQGVRFHDGEPCNVDAVVASFARHLDEKRGLAASGRIRAVVAEVKALDEPYRTVRAEEALCGFLRLIAGNAAAIVSPKARKGRHARP